MRTRGGVVAGVLLMLLGVGSNWLVRLLNGGMPAPGIAYSFPPTAFNGKTPLWEGTRLGWLADVLPARNSVGDVLLGIGLAVFAVSAALYLVKRYRVPSGKQVGALPK
jgi:hypothetical protein